MTRMVQKQQLIEKAKKELSEVFEAISCIVDEVFEPLFKVLSKKIVTKNSTTWFLHSLFRIVQVFSLEKKSFEIR